MTTPASEPNPLLSVDPASWNQLIAALHPPSMLVAIAARMSPALRARYAPEDVWQETLLHAWRDRAACEWQGIAAFRRWLLTIAEHRLANLADREGAHKRGHGAEVLPLSPHPSQDSQSPGYAGPIASTTPSRAASDREIAQGMAVALASLPDDVREVVRLRMFEGLPIAEVALRLSLGESGVRHRFRRGVELFTARLKREHGSTG